MKNYTFALIYKLNLSIARTTT